MKRKLKADLRSQSAVYEFPASETFPLVVRSPLHSSDVEERSFDFEFASSFGAFASILAEQFLRFTRGRTWETVYGEFVSVRLTLKYFIARNLFRNIDPSHCSRRHWKYVLKAWADDLKSLPVITDVTVNRHITNASKFFRHLMTVGVVPTFALPTYVPGAKNKRRLSIAEIVPNFDQVDIALHHASKAELDIWKRLSGLTDVSDPAVIIARTDLLVNVLRLHADKKMREIWARFQTAELEIRLSKFDVEGYIEAFEIKDGEKLKRRRGWREQLMTIGNLLKYIEIRYGGIIPHRLSDPHLNNFIYKVYSKNELIGALYAKTEDIVPFLIPILFETAMNVSCAANLSENSLSIYSRKEKLIEWIKPRAGYITLSHVIPSGSIKQLELDATQHVNASQAFSCLWQLTERLRQQAAEKDVRKLCLSLSIKVKRRKLQITPLDASSISRKWRQFKDDSRILRLFSMTLANIRETVLLREFLISGGDIFKIKALAKHKTINSTIRYVEGAAASTVNRGPPREVHDYIILGATTRADIRQGLGIDDERARFIVNNAKIKTGFLDYRTSSYAEDNEEKAPKLVRWILGGEHIILRQVGLAAEIIAFRDHLIREVPLLKGSTSYEQLWAPLLVLLNLAVDRMPPDLWLQASDRSKQCMLIYPEIV